MTKKALIYVDGSYDPLSKTIGCAYAFFEVGGTKPYRSAFKRKLEVHFEHGSNIAEFLAVKTALKAAISLSFGEVLICYDWNGISHFADERNLRNRHKECTSFLEYAAFIKESRKSILIKFRKVKAHSNDQNNRLVDRMAKYALN